ncbi:hypothetical protein [Burkholderia gladioli]|uniref:hypothetical protein n=1 Tax=Burkholderia gladioli TaxID=28095 RepID=UPI00163F58C5|nr:hypothetical protein [Burkholderia gladioli]
MQSRLSSRNTFLQPSLIRFGCAVDENAVLPQTTDDSGKLVEIQAEIIWFSRPSRWRTRRELSGVGKAQARIPVARQFMQESGGAFHAVPMPGPDRAVDGPVISLLVARFDQNP